MKIAILGGGNGCYAAAADLSANGHEIRFWRRNAVALRPVAEAGGIELIDYQGTRDVPVHLTTGDMAAAVAGADVILLPIPAIAQPDILAALAPLLTDGQGVLMPPGTFGTVILIREMVKTGSAAEIMVGESGTLPYLTRRQGDRSIAIVTRATRLPTGFYPLNRADEALALFRQVYPLKAGDTFLYHAAAGGVGLIACQWARALGAHMIGTVSTDEKAEIARANGCEHVIVTSRENIAECVREITDGKGVPVVYDSVGKDTLMASLDSLQVRGVLVSNGSSSGPVNIDSMLLAVKGSLWVTRPAMVHYATPRAKMLQMADEVFDMVLSGKIVSEPSQVFALDQAAEAHAALESRKTVGATVLIP